MMKKAAVVIGVDKTGNLAKLHSAVTGAEAVASWLKGEGYDVECLTDKAKPVKAEDVENTVAKFVTLPPKYGLLVVYFSGHGYWHARADRWLLSGAPTSTSQAINLDGAMYLARYSGIPNVVFISDACRSIPDSHTGAKVTGIDAFPNFAEISEQSKVDVFKATSEARAAYESDIDGKQQSVLTYALMSAFKKPEPDMIREVNEGTNRARVVPNRELAKYLQDIVNEILADIDINLTQDIEANVSSSDDVYIARVHALARPLSLTKVRGGIRGTPETKRLSVRSAGRDAANIIARRLAGIDRRTGNHAADEVMAVSDLAMESKLEARLPSGTVDHFESAVGFTVQGAKIVKAVTTKGEKDAYVELLEQGDGGNTAAIIRLWDVRPAVSVAIQLEDGRFAILAGLPGHIGHAYFDETGLSNVSYVPSSNHERWEWYKEKKSQIDRMRALVALAVEDNTFQIRSEAEAEAVGETIRMVKAIDPTLGLYAAYAFSQASRDDRILSVMNFMRGDLQTDLFDVRALASRQVPEQWAEYPFTPFCPMLTQTWNLLRPRGIHLPPVLRNAIPYLCNSLWTTFQPKVAESIILAIKMGEL